MTFTTRLRVGAAVLAAGAALTTAAPAYAQTDPAPPAKLTEVKARADEAVKDRLTQIDKLSARLHDAAADCAPGLGKLAVGLLQTGVEVVGAHAGGRRGRGR